ncbi:MAG: enoyl-CoA hydratase/isomerase family protein [bacterium]
MRETVGLNTRYLDAHIEEGVLHVRINRAQKRNSMTQDMYRGLKKALVLADETPEIDVVCITGTDDVFCVGGDMSGEMEHREEILAEPDQTDHHPFRHLERCRKLVVCSVNGKCHAGGLNLVLFSDITIAATSATFRVPEILRGIPDPHMSGRLPYFVGVAKAKYMIFTAAEFGAEEACEMGILAKTVEDDQLETATAELLVTLRRTGPRARMLAKDDINGRLPMYEIRTFTREMMSPEMSEGMMAFLEKREPKWPKI